MEKSRSEDTGRIPPQNIDAEKSLLGAIMLSEDIFANIITTIHPSDFYDKRHAHIYRAMMSLYDSHRPIDLTTVTAELKSQKTLKEVGGAPYISELTNFVPTASHANAYADLIKKASVKRRLINSCTNVINQVYTSNAEVPELVGQVEKDLFEVTGDSKKDELTSLSDLLADSYERINRLRENKGALRGLKTGFHDIDKKTAGFQKGELVVIGARPAMGKTTLAQNLAYNVAKINKCGVLFFSMEMSSDEIVDRILSDISDIKSWNIRNGLLSDDEFSKIGNSLSDLDETPLYIDDSSSMNVLDLRNKARRAAHDHNIGMIILDYLQLLQGTDRYAGNRVQEVTEISRGLKTLARELEIPVVALAQLSRNVTGREDPRPVLSDLRESGSIEQDADLVMFLHRPDYYHQNDDSYTPTNTTELIIAKHRHGSLGKIDLFFEGDYNRFRSLDTSHD